MARIANVLFSGLLVITAGTLGTRLRRGKIFGKMNPEAVAQTLSSVEEKWLTDAVAFAECNATDNTCQEDTMGEFKKSCQTVVQSLLQGSDGDKANVAEYLGDICSQEQLHGWKRNMCNNFAGALNQALTDDNLVNRDDLPVDNICSKFLTRGFLKDAAKEEIVRAEKEKQKQEALAAQQEKEQEEAEHKAALELEDEQKAAAKAKAAKEAAELATKIRNEAKAKVEEASQKATNSSSAEGSSTAEAIPNTGLQNSTGDAVNSSASLPAVNSTVTASEEPPVTASEEPPVASNGTAPAVPAQTGANQANATASAGTNSTAPTDTPSNKTQ